MPSLETLIIEAIGWIGAALIIAGYILITLGKVNARSYLFQGMNVLGATGIVINSVWNGAIPSAGLNTVWALIGLAALIGIARGAKSQVEPDA